MYEPMTLNEYAAKKRLALYEDLLAGREPSEGAFSNELLADGRVKGPPQMGTTRYEPNAIICEFIYPDARTSATVLSVRLESPERIVFMPVPSWVVENIWQGDIAGTHHFESESARLMLELERDLTPDGNLHWFDKQAAKRRE